MGNCLVIQDRNKEIKIMSMDGEILKMPPSCPLNGVPRQAHGVVSDDALPAGDPAGGAVVRVKLVVSKQELKKMLLHNDGISLDDMVSLMHKEAEADGQQEISCRVWRPTLQSIPEGSVFF
ncbi:hypothetical protein E2562_024538 [Oryza meyeriana var. granulata]|uniref:Uncharacterized protein n=1 Tax=Oryza meyeriana var. granulata TaxID=110450 RepID=A0A6G1BNC9_9ORYZ|nr:hypothetical protein E2562_024538 [Oryza meyeriana var. granulata]